MHRQIEQKKEKIAYKRNTGVSDSDSRLFTNLDDVELLNKLGFEVNPDEYLFLAVGDQREDVYSYVEKVAGVSKEVSKAIDKGESFSAEYLKELDYDVPKGYELKGDLCCPIEKKASDIYNNIIIENPKGSKKEFGKNYPIPVMTYPVDYGYLPGYTAQDEADLDFFKGTAQKDGLHGSFDVWRPDVKGELETKFYTGATELERDQILKAFQKVIRGTPKAYVSDDLIEAIKHFAVNKEPAKTASVKTFYHGSPTEGIKELEPRLDPRLNLMGAFVADSPYAPELFSLMPERHKAIINTVIDNGKFISGEVTVPHENWLNEKGYLYEFDNPKSLKERAKDRYMLTEKTVPDRVKEVLLKDVLARGWKIKVKDKDVEKTEQSFQQKKAEDDYVFAHYNPHGEHKQLRPLTYLELLKDRSRGRWEDKPELAQKYVDDRKAFEATLGKELTDAGLPYDPEKSFLYGAVLDHERFGQPGAYQHLSKMPDLDKTFFTIAGLDDKDHIGRGKKGLDNAIKLWLENKDKLKDTEYMGMTIRPRVEVMTQESVNPYLIKKIEEQLNKQAAADHALKSTNIKAVGYDKKDKTLEVEFHSGGTYKYNDVPKTLFDRIKRVKSPGKFFHKHIRKDDKYEYSKLEKEHRLQDK